MGVGGKTTLKFKAVGSGCNASIQLAYVQPWNFKSWSHVAKTKINLYATGRPVEVLDPNLKTFNF